MNNITERNKHEQRFKIYGKLAVSTAVFLLLILLYKIFSTGISAFQQTYIGVKVEMQQTEDISNLDARQKFREQLRAMFPELTSRSDKRNLYSLFSVGASYEFDDFLKSNDGKAVDQYIYFLASDDVDMYIKEKVKKEGDTAGRLSSSQLKLIDVFKDQNLIKLKLNKYLFTSADSREPEMAGILGAIIGSFYAILIAFISAFPIGVLTALYLEKMAKKNKFADIIETNINNLAAVPSIVFGLLGLAIFLNFFDLPRSAPLVGGLTLGLMTLPTIVIASRAAIKSVPPSIEEASIGVGASKVQTMFNFTLPLAMPGILTGTIIGIAQAIGETAPLLMIGMVAFVVDIPAGPLDAATALPVQIYLWADSPERAFVERTSAAIMVLLIFLFILNITAIYLRKKLEKKW